MVNSHSSRLPLSQRVQDLIREVFAEHQQSTVREWIGRLHGAPALAVDERIHLDILKISNGRLGKLRQAVELANQDWRDLMMTAEYELKEGKIVQNERDRARPAEVAAHQDESASRNE